MTQPENAFLTDNRRAVLKGTSDWSDAAVSNEKSRIKNRARLALAELIEVADSPHIDNTDVFEPDQVAELVHRLFVPDFGHVEGGGLVTDPRSDQDTDFPTAEYSDDYRQYRDHLYVALDKPMRTYRDSRFPDPTESE